MNVRRAQSGYTLVEVLGYAAILLVILNLSAPILIGTKRLHTLATLAIERNEVLEEVARDFRETVHDSTGIAEDAAGLPETPGVVALAAKGPGTNARYYLWRRDENGRLYLDEYSIGTDRKITLTSRKVYSPCLKVLEMTVAGDADAALAVFDLTVDNEGTLRTVPRTNRFIAALGTS